MIVDTLETLILSIKEDSLICICPSCNNVGKEEDGQPQVGDYVTHPMIWCDKCGARFVVDDHLSDGDTIKNSVLNDNDFEWTEQRLKLKDKIMKYVEENYDNIEEYKFSVVTFAFILKVVGNDHGNYYSSTPLTQEQIREFVSSNYDEDIVNKYNIQKCEWQCIDFTDTDGKPLDGNFKFNLALDCNSYDTGSPEVEYPPNTRLNHDGVYVHLWCKDSDGYTFEACYCGD